MIWHPYPQDPTSEYALQDDLVLRAENNGAWSVYSKTSRVLAQGSQFSPILGPYTLAEAKLAAEEAAQHMLDE
jgi:hypothetical protein